MRIPGLGSAIAVTTLNFAAAGPSHAACSFVPDQDQAAFAGILFQVFADVDEAQTFTPGLSGPLTRLRLAGMISVTPDPGDVLVVEIRAAPGGIPDGNGVPLARTTVPFSALPTTPGEFFVDLPEPYANAQTGVPLAIVLRADRLFQWSGASGSPYGGGARYFRGPAFPEWTVSPDHDAVFETFVCTGTVAIRSTSWGKIRSLYR